MASYLHTMYRITDPERSRAFYEALGFEFSRDLDIVRNGELEATNYFFSMGDTRASWSSPSTTTDAHMTWATRWAHRDRRGRSRRNALALEGAGDRARTGALPR
jgi:catechol 2,3-dioxygenase-like lactoylglutathione lyase family enzyme